MKVTKHLYNDMKDSDLLFAADFYESYEGDSIHLYKVGRDYVLFFDSQCSCYGPFEQGSDTKGDTYTKAQLKKLVGGWKDKSGAEPLMKEWVEKNL